MLGPPGAATPARPEADRWVPRAGAPPRPVKARTHLDPALGRAHARGARATARRRRRWWRGRAEEGWRGPGKARTARRRRRRTSPARARAKSGSGLAARRTGAAAGEGERRRPCRGGEGAGLGVERVEGSEEMLHPRRIDEGLTEDDESTARAELGQRWQWGTGKELGFEGKGPVGL